MSGKECATKILKNSISNVYVIPIAIIRATKLSSYHEVSDNVISGEWGQHAIIVKGAGYSVIRRNRVTGQRIGNFIVNTDAAVTVYSQSGNYFTPNCVGKFIIFNGGVERLITSYVSPTIVGVGTAIGAALTGVTAAWGNGDMISVEGGDDCDVSENIVNTSASLGLSVFSNGTWSADRNKIYKNRVANQGSAGISLQNIAGTFVRGTMIEGNNVIDCGLNLTAAHPDYNVGISCRGGANTQRVTVMGNIIEGYLSSMRYGIAFDAAVTAKSSTGNIITGTTVGTIENP